MTHQIKESSSRPSFPSLAEANQMPQTQAKGSPTLGVLLTAYAYKSKPKTKKWKRRFLVLTCDTLHWFKRQEGSSLFGNEKGSTPLSEVVHVLPLVDPEAKKFEIATKDGRKRWLMMETPELCSLWVNAVDQAKQGQQEGNLVSGSGLDRQDTLDGLNFMEYDVSRPDVMMISVGSTDTSREIRPERVSRRGRVSWGSSCNVELRDPVHEMLNIMLSTGEVATLHCQEIVQACETYEALHMHLEKGSIELGIEADEAVIARIAAKRQDPSGPLWKRLVSGFLGLDPESANNANQAYGLATLFLAAAASALLSKDYKNHLATCILGGLLAIRTFILTFQEGEKTDTFFAGEPLIIQVTLFAFHSDTKAVGSSNLPPIPQKFVDGCFGDMVEAKRRWAITYRWRIKEKIDTILDQPQPHFTTIKKAYPHFLCGKAKSGNLVYFEQLGHIDLPTTKMVGVDNMVHHFLFITEYLWRILDPREEGKTVSVLDIKNVKLADLHGDAMEFLKKCTSTMQNHYPESCEVIILANCPTWFSLLWKIVKPLINEITQKKIRIVNESHTLQALLEFVDISQIPPEYGGKAPYGKGAPGGCRFNSPQELALAEFAMNIGKTPPQTKQKQLESTSEPLDFKWGETAPVFPSIDPEKLFAKEEVIKPQMPNGFPPNNHIKSVPK